MDITRRNLVKGAGAIAGAAAMGLGAQMALAAPAKQSEVAWDAEYDVVVVGSGAAGCPASVGAAADGASVVVIEQRDWAGGRFRRSGGGIAAACSQVQEYLGVEDDVDSYYEFYMAATLNLCDPERVRAWCENSAGVIDWVIDELGGQPLGDWDFCGGDEGLTYNGGPGLNVGTSIYEGLGFEPIARTHWFTMNEDDAEIIDDESKCAFSTFGGTGLYKTFRDNMDALGVEVMLETPFKRFVVADNSNEVLGVVAEHDGTDFFIKARKGVVCACGNFASNVEMHRNYVGYDYEPGSAGGIGNDMPDDNNGVAINAALALGAALYCPYMDGTVDGDTTKARSHHSGGVNVDVTSRVLDVYGEPIPRLFGAGTFTGGTLLYQDPTCGTSIGTSLYFGRIAGQQAAALENWDA